MRVSRKIARLSKNGCADERPWHTLRAVHSSDFASTIEKLLRRLAQGHAGTRSDMLLATASGDAVHLANTLWAFVRAGHGGLVGYDRAVVGMLVAGTFDAHDFLTLLRQLKSANLEWFEGWTKRTDGLAYHGWCQELEVLLDKLLTTTEDRTTLEWADVSEPAGSALLLALGRRGFVEAQTLPPDALPRFAAAFLEHGSRCPEQFAGWERLWPVAAFGRALFACANNAMEVGVYPDTLAPFVPYANPVQLACVVEKLVWSDDQALDWLTAHGKAIVPHLQHHVEELLKNVKAGFAVESDEGRLVVALARIRAKNKEQWPTAWMPLAKRMLESGTTGVEDVLAIVAPDVRERLLVDYLNSDATSKTLLPLSFFPTPRLIEALVTRIRQRRKEDSGWYDPRREYVKVLGNMGTVGQNLLVKFLDEPMFVAIALEHLAVTPENATRVARHLGSSDESVRRWAEKIWLDLPHEERMELLNRHLGDLPLKFAAHLLGLAQHDLRVVDLATRLPETTETHHWRNLCLHPPAILEKLRASLANTPEDQIVRAANALAPAFAKERRLGFQEQKALAAFGAEDLLAIVHVTASRSLRRETMFALCKHFGPLCREIPWIAAFWWTHDRTELLTIAADVLGPGFVPALHASVDCGTLREGSWNEVLRIFTKHDPVGGLDHFARVADNLQYRLYVEEGVAAALERDSMLVQEWLRRALSGKEREFALFFLSKHAVPELVPSLQALEKEKLAAKLKKLLQAALEAQKTLGSMVRRGNKSLTVRRVQKMAGPIDALRMSRDGQTLLAQSGGNVMVWRGERVATLTGSEPANAELSDEGKFVLILEANTIQVFAPWDGAGKTHPTLLSGDDFDGVVPMPGNRAMTMCNAEHGSVVLWNLETGESSEHKLHGPNELPACVNWLDDKRYLVGTTEDKTLVREFASGKILQKLLSWADQDCGGVYQVGSGNEGKLVASLFVDGSLMIWDISGPRVKALGRHHRVAPRALVVDPSSSWVVTPGAMSVITWKNGQQARALESSGPTAVRRGQLAEEAGTGVFVRPNVVAIGGQSVDIWDLEANLHLGRWDKPATAMVSAQGKLFVGDAEGNIWELNEG